MVAFAQYFYVRLIDADPSQTGSPFGEADIDSIGAISSAPPVATHAPGALAIFALGVAGLGWRRRKA